MTPVSYTHLDVYKRQEEEIKRVKTVLASPDSGLCLRDKAVGLLALFTGLRGCDILGLKLKDIDWELSLIHI